MPLMSLQASISSSLSESASSSGDRTLVLHSSIDDLDLLENAWRALTPESAAPFQTFAWNAAWYRCYARGSHEAAIFELRDSTGTLAILPGYREGKAIRLAADRICDFQDVIARDDQAVTELLQHLCIWLANEGRGCHFLFDRVSNKGCLGPALSDPDRFPEGALRFEKMGAPCPYVNLRDGLDSYLATLPRKARGDMRHSLNRFHREAADAQIMIYRDFEIRVEDLWSAAAFHVEHFRKSGESPFMDHRLIDLFGQITKDPEVGFQLSFLHLDGDLIAIDFGFVRGGRYYGYLSAFDAKQARIAPSKCLLLKRIDTWIDEDGVEILDFLAGDESYKRRFTGSTDYRVSSLRMMPDDFSHRVRQAGLESEERVRQLAKRVLRREEGLMR